ncbi:MAG: 50S ribosomal protein L29 [Ignavibacteria bacterium]|nr:50S ribosomal protein L29 [Ignavibacteria bacterium]
MKLYQIKELSTKDLKHSLKDSMEALQNYRFQHSTGQLENYKAMKTTKRDIARMLTVLKQREKEEKNTDK